MTPTPLVSVIIPMRNEQEYIGACLNSILTGDYPADRLEIILIDDGSTDRSREIAAQYSSANPQIRLLDNVRRTIPSALNEGIQSAHGEIIVRMDAHAVYDPGYIRLCVRYLSETDADCVGGLQRGKGETPVGRAIAVAMASRFGGGAAYRISRSRRYADTVYLGAWRRETLSRLAGPDGTIFNESLPANEDYELNYRLRAKGGKILLAPDIVSTYFVRPSLGKLAAQYFRYGLNKARMLFLHPASLKPRQLASPALVAGLIFSIPAILAGSALGWLLPCLYAAATAAASVIGAVKHGGINILLLPPTFAAMHLSWGLGFFTGLPGAAIRRATR